MHISKLGLNNSAVYLFEQPVEITGENTDIFPETILLRCVLKSGEIYLLPKERQKCAVSEIFSRNELSLKCSGYVAFTLFYSRFVYGILICELTSDIYYRGDYISLQLGKTFYLNELRKRLHMTE